MKFQSPSTSRVVAALLALRIVNALTTATFFQPDEYFQALEPAWQLAFGRESGAWITWEWKARLRSSAHPLLFALVYRLADLLASLLHLDSSRRAELLVAAPKACQAVLAAAGDLATWKLAEMVYGRGSRASLAALALTACSPWQWFCSTRTLSNSLETTLTAAALSLWLRSGPVTRPNNEVGVLQQRLRHNVRSARLSTAGPTGPSSSASFLSAAGTTAADATDTDTTITTADLQQHQQRQQQHQKSHPERQRYQNLALLLAATACLLRPTNVLVWLCVGLHTLFLHLETWHARLGLARTAFVCGSVVAFASAVADRLYFGAWTVPPLRFLYFNLVRSVAVFYGRNRGDYYVTEGLPLLLTTALPFAVVGLWQTLLSGWRIATSEASDNGKSEGKSDVDRDANEESLLRLFALTVVFVTLSMSLIAHKEVRFLYPVLPILHVLAARPLCDFFVGFPPPSLTKKSVLALLVGLSVLVTVYTTQYHQRGVLDVLDFIRRQHETDPRSFNSVVFLMPCHSTPWRSHLVHPPLMSSPSSMRSFGGRLEGLHARALTCEPPLDVPVAERATYVDQADIFYHDPAAWLLSGSRSLKTLYDGAGCSPASLPLSERHPSSSSSFSSSSSPHTSSSQDRGASRGSTRTKVTPDAFVFFEQLEPTMLNLSSSPPATRGPHERREHVRYVECWRGWNTHWHDDWRRQGDVVVWCRNEAATAGDARSDTDQARAVDASASADGSSNDGHGRWWEFWFAECGFDADEGEESPGPT